MSDQFLDTQPKAQADLMIVADSNTVGAGISRYAPDFVAIVEAAARAADFFAYQRDFFGVREDVASYLDQPIDSILIGGSGMSHLTEAPSIYRCKSVVMVSGDFAGYSRPEQLGIPIFRSKSVPGYDPRNLEWLLQELSGRVRPFVPLTAGRTNPGLTVIDAPNWVSRIKAACPSAIVCLDLAYAEIAGSGVRETAKAILDLGLTGVEILIPVSKTLFVPAIRQSWLLSTDPTLLAAAGQAAYPYPVGLGGFQIVKALVRRPELVLAINEVIRQTEVVLAEGLRKELLGQARVVSGGAAWVNIYFDGASKASSFVRFLAAGGIMVQAQRPMPEGLGSHVVRISVTVKAEADAIIARTKEWVSLKVAGGAEGEGRRVAASIESLDWSRPDVANAISGFISSSIKADYNGTAAGSLLYVDARDLLDAGSFLAVQFNSHSDVPEIDAVAVATPNQDREIVIGSVAKRFGASSMQPRIAVAKALDQALRHFPSYNPVAFIRQFPSDFIDSKGRRVGLNPASYRLFREFGFEYIRTDVIKIDSRAKQHLKASADPPSRTTYRAAKFTASGLTPSMVETFLASIRT
ncbi:PLP-dependent aminotransferase family protein [Aquidulcibacter paucihalophilus]|uniref:hypothetical protein n=1 Tax=Aquidulcibacter paucihalophilus TaxID=1978549 RepID=UPI000A18D9BD|nr:hypothetical protein [Aquidulcibacter paucihalophilus]